MTDPPHSDSWSGAPTHASPEGTMTVADAGGSARLEVSRATSIETQRYVVLEELGRGGMGRVLRAYDPKLQREVALKEVHRGALDEVAAARLVLEARAMAKLSHPNVVAVFDVDELGPRQVVVAMEYVRGSTLQAWLTSERDWRAVVEMLVLAGRGLAAAHAAGLLHRDFKPANVLVSEGGVAKVTDFGLAKITEAGATPEPCSERVDVVANDMTDAGAVMGTPRYMAPEQHFGEALTPAADQYAFCVTLWESLCGQPPFLGMTLAALVHQKREGPPTWPNASVPRPISEAIVRGLSPRPSDRWPSMEALLDALAWDPLRRRRRWLLGLGAVAVLGSFFAASQAWIYAQTARCSGARARLEGIWDEGRREAVKAAVLGIDRSYAPGVWERAEQELDAYAAQWMAMHTEACEATTVRGEQSAAVMDLRMACLNRAAVELGAVTSQLVDADEQVVQRAHALTGELRPLSRCADVDALTASVEPPLPHEAAAVEEVRARLAAAEAADRAGRYSAAKAAVEAARAAAAELHYGPVHTELALVEGVVLEALGEYAAAEASWSDALALASRWRQWSELREAALRLASVLGERRSRVDEATRYVRMAEGLAHGDSSQEAAVANVLGNLLKDKGSYEEAEVEHRKALALREQALGPDHPQLASLRANLASDLRRQGRLEEAELEHRKALALRERALGPDHPDVATLRNNLANTLEERGRFAEAEAEHRSALALREQALGTDHPLVAASRNRLADLLLGQGRPAEALELAELVWRQRQREDTPPSLRARAAFLLAEALWQARADTSAQRRAVALAERAIEELESAHGDRKQSLAEVRAWLEARRAP